MKKPLLLDDTYSENLNYRSQCMKCKNLIHIGSCSSFDLIPMDIWTASNNCKYFEENKK